MILRTAATKSSATIDDIQLQAVQSIEGLLAEIARELNLLDDDELAFDETLMLLEAMPLNTDEFGLAANRLRNAERYVRSHELGAAGYELRLLLHSLTRGQKQRSGRPYRHRSR